LPDKCQVYFAQKYEPTGTGKQVLAFAIHRLDQKRNPFPFVTMHCGSLSETLAESESDTPREAGGLVSGAASKVVAQVVLSSR
jgi:transcriptional regulator of acetoin/glycerol metabolism